MDGINVRVSDLCITNKETGFGIVNLIGGAVKGSLSQGESIMLRPVPPFLVLNKNILENVQILLKSIELGGKIVAGKSLISKLLFELELIFLELLLQKLKRGNFGLKLSSYRVSRCNMFPSKINKVNCWCSNNWSLLEYGSVHFCYLIIIIKYPLF